MGNFKLKLNYAGIGQLLRSSEMAAAVESKASEIAARAGSGYAASSAHSTGQRQAANVYPTTAEARQEVLESNSLLKAMR